MVGRQPHRAMGFESMIDALPIAVRAYTEPTRQMKTRQRRRLSTERARYTLVFDTETRTDAAQALTFGSYRFFDGARCVEEGIFYADELEPKELECLREYTRTRWADLTPPLRGRLWLRSRRDFLKKFYEATYKARCLLVGFNLPFDLSRLAFNVGEARDDFAGGFSLAIWDRTLADESIVENKFRPRITIKHIDSKRALKSFTKAAGTDDIDRIPEGAKAPKADPAYTFRGHFLDLRTLAFALTDRGHSLDSACKAFGVKNSKLAATSHGTVTVDYIDYNRRDVQATSELYFKLIEEYERHPIDLQATKAFSPASIGKGYLRSMGIRPILQKQPQFSRIVLGNTMSAFYGGRAGAHIRRTVTPIVYCDFLSMYPTVNSLMGLWRFVIANSIDVIDSTQEVRRFLDRIGVDALFEAKTWRRLIGFIQLEPNDDILPARAKYDDVTGDWQIGVNYVRLDPDGSEESLWYSLPDVVASVLLTGRVPKIKRAILLKARGQQRGLRPIKLRGEVLVDPTAQDFFKTVIEQRKGLTFRTDLTERERERLDKTLKVLANATSYGILAEMTRHELPSGRTAKVTVYGVDQEAFECSVNAPEEAGEFCFPPLAALITGAARLQLALLERCVTDLGGTYAMEDTDSMAIVATKNGGLVPCVGGSSTNAYGESCVTALSWTEVKAIQTLFESLNPYDPTIVKGSILKIEDDNFDLDTGVQRQIYCFAISAKRYARFLIDADGKAVLLRCGVNNASDGWSEHGLGHLLNPTDPDSEDRAWIGEVWQSLIDAALGHSVRRPPWYDRPALTRISVSSPTTLRPFDGLNRGKTYVNRVKPFNFLLSAHLAPDGHPTGVDRHHFHLVAPYESDPRKWESLKWIDRYSGRRYKASTLVSRGAADVARLSTYGDLLEAFAYHPEAKSAEASGTRCMKQTVGILRRRHFSIAALQHVGKEANRLDDVLAGVVHSVNEVMVYYIDPKRQPWRADLSAAISTYGLRALARISKVSRSTIQRILNGNKRPHKSTVQALRSVVTVLSPQNHTERQIEQGPN